MTPSRSRTAPARDSRAPASPTIEKPTDAVAPQPLERPALDAERQPEPAGGEDRARPPIRGPRRSARPSARAAYRPPPRAPPSRPACVRSQRLTPAPGFSSPSATARADLAGGGGLQRRARHHEDRERRHQRAERAVAGRAEQAGEDHGEDQRDEVVGISANARPPRGRCPSRASACSSRGRSAATSCSRSSSGLVCLGGALPGELDARARAPAPPAAAAAPAPAPGAACTPELLASWASRPVRSCAIDSGRPPTASRRSASRTPPPP